MIKQTLKTSKKKIMKKGTYIDYNIILACLSKAPAKSNEQPAEVVAPDSSLLLPALREKLGLHGRFVSLASRYGNLQQQAHPEAA